MFKSIRGSLLILQTLVLFGVMGSFGTILYFELRRAILDSIDTELRARAEKVSHKWKEYPPEKVKSQLSESFDSGIEGSVYYVVWSRDDRILASSKPIDPPPRPAGEESRSRGEWRELAVWGPGETRILVGRSMGVERKYVWLLMGTMAGAGAALLALALLLAWLLTGRALRPIARMTEAATAISASSLDRRLETSRAASELRELAVTLNRTFDRLQEAFERQTRFTADASHELRTPLSIIYSACELALRGQGSDDDVRRCAEMSLRSARRMKDVVEGLLVLARADAGEIQLRKEAVDLRALVEETARFVEPLVVERRISLSIEDAPASVTGDHDRLRDAVSNLITNAVRHNREGGSVEITLSTSDQSAVLTVTDSGPGIPEADRPHIFERFYRVEAARSRGLGGSGLGLAITKWVVEQHGGTIDFVSRVGEGTTFTVTLPLATP